jgi:4-hydroxythreonine-4-phosphate dehydrogenase
LSIAEVAIFDTIAPLAISLGDPAGVGPEITAKAWEQRSISGLPPFFALGDRAALASVWGGPIAEVSDAEGAAQVFDHALPIIHIEDAGPLALGQPTAAGAHCALVALELGIGLTRAGEASGLVTAPVSKIQLQSVGFTHPGQTEFIAERCGVSPNHAIMMLAGPGLRVFPITVHVPLRTVADLLTTDLIVSRTLLAARGLERSFGLTRPRLAMAGFNPHAGENGALGREEIDIIIPAVERLCAEGLDVTGPHSPDAMFSADARAGYDAAMCLYHDQGLIPLKALYFDEGVNATLGLPIVRTSPDHGTAFGIAGTGRANPGAMIAAIKMAAETARHRQSAAA